MASTEQIAGADLLDWQAQSHAFSGWLAERRVDAAACCTGTPPIPCVVAPVTANYFSVLGGPPLIGRGLDDGGSDGARRRHV